MSDGRDPGSDGEPVDAPDYAADDWEDPAAGSVPAEELPEGIVEDVPRWADDPYLDRVSDRLMYSYDLERDHREADERWELYGEMRVRNRKQFFHPALSYADHEAEEYLFVRRTTRPTVAELKRLVDLGHDVAAERVEGHEEHYRTDVTFVIVAAELPADVRAFVDGFRDRTLLKLGYYGHYEVNLGVVVPDRREAVASETADAVEAFVLWEPVTEPDEGLLSRFARRFWT